MSAIWGAIDLSGKSISDTVKRNLRTAYDKCAIDRIQEIDDKNVYMGCGIQFFTKEAEKEQLPFSKDEKIFFTADVVLDNREMLAGKLGLSEQELDEMPDGELLFQIYERFGKACLNDLLGAYSFVYFDRRTNVADLVIDAVGNRCVYYQKVGSLVLFSTLMCPVQDASGDHKINGRWVADFLAMDSMIPVNENTETPIAGIKRVAPGAFVEITKDTTEEKRYWNPLDRTIRYTEEEKYKDEFCRIFSEAVSCVLRSGEETAILLSGGFDSNAVNSVAAPILKNRGKKLLSFTSVPDKNFKIQNNESCLVDESELVRETAKYYDNLECHFVDLSGQKIWEKRTEMLHILETPYKSVQNVMWKLQSSLKARENHARIILSGEFGNTTISYSDMRLFFYELFHTGKWARFFSEATEFSLKNGIYRKNIFKDIFAESLRNKKASAENIIRNSYVSETAMQKYNIRSRMKNMDKVYTKAAHSSKQFRKLVCKFNTLRQIGEMETKRSLYTGVLLRDPTKDKRVIEFCVQMPYEEFQKHGEERRLTSVYLKDIVPSHILTNRKAGIQSGDIKSRLEEEWSLLKAECMQFLEESDSEYVDVQRLMKDIAQIDFKNEVEQFDLVRILYTVMIEEYAAAQNAAQHEKKSGAGSCEPMKKGI